jgi:hypothetical protein
VLWRQEFHGRVRQRDTTDGRVDPSRVSRSVSGVERWLQRLKGNAKTTSLQLLRLENVRSRQVLLLAGLPKN